MRKIKKRRITWKKKQNNRTDQEIFREKQKLLRQIDKMKKEGYLIIYIDETMFTKGSVPKSEYCLPR